MFNFALAGTLPVAATDAAVRWNGLYSFLIWMSVFFFVLVVGGMLYFAVAYRDRPGIKTKYLTGNTVLEAIWIFVPTVLLLVIFGWGYSVYREMTQAPSDAYEIRVVGKQWLWQFQYDTGKVSVGEVFVPLNKPVKFVMSSEDVLHDFFIPSFRVKQDVVPGMYSSVWFEARVPGMHQVFCSQYCGTSHSGMLAKLYVLTDPQWKEFTAGKKITGIPSATWGEDEVAENETAPASVAGATSDQVKASAASPRLRPAGLTLAEQGREVFATKGCVSCHSSDGSPKTGPTLKGVYGHMVELTDGTNVQADENYVRESIELPSAKVVKGFNPVMPTFKGLVSETEMNALVAYIKSLK